MSKTRSSEGNSDRLKGRELGNRIPGSGSSMCQVGLCFHWQPLGSFSCKSAAESPSVSWEWGRGMTQRLLECDDRVCSCHQVLSSTDFTIARNFFDEKFFMNIASQSD